MRPWVRPAICSRWERCCMSAWRPSPPSRGANSVEILAAVLHVDPSARPPAVQSASHSGDGPHRTEGPGQAAEARYQSADDMAADLRGGGNGD